MLLNFKEYFYAQSNTEYEVVNLYLSFRKVNEIAAVKNISVAEVYRILHRNDIVPNRVRPNHQNVLDFASSGLSVIQIAELTGYTPRNVRYILSKLKTENNA
jgi:hypothetical protein